MLVIARGYIGGLSSSGSSSNSMGHGIHSHLKSPDIPKTKWGIGFPKHMIVPRLPPGLSRYSSLATANPLYGGFTGKLIHKWGIFPVPGLISGG